MTKAASHVAALAAAVLLTLVTLAPTVSVPGSSPAAVLLA